jgi:DNA-binding transcriptional LysR family regulator
MTLATALQWCLSLRVAKRDKPYDVRLADVTTFLAVQARGSVTAAARSLGTTPSQVSKSMVRLERQIGERLLARSSRGVTLTTAAVRVMPFLTTAVDALLKVRRGANVSRDVTVGAPSYLLHAFVPALARTMGTLRFRGVQLAPGTILAQMGLRQFEVALSIGETTHLPKSWRAEQVGQVASGLFGPPALARRLGTLSLERLLEVPFITPVSFTGGQWQPVDDGCPLLVGERTAGHEAPTISLGLAIAAEVGQLVFGPRIAALEYVQQKRLVEFKVPGWNVLKPAFLAVDIDRVTIRELKQIKAVASALLERR